VVDVAGAGLVVVLLVCTVEVVKVVEVELSTALLLVVEMTTLLVVEVVVSVWGSGWPAGVSLVST